MTTSFIAAARPTIPSVNIQLHPSSARSTAIRLLTVTRLKPISIGTSRMRRIRPIELVISQVCGLSACLQVASVTTLARQGYRVGHHEMRYAHLATREVIEHDARCGRAPPECVVSVAVLRSSTAPMGFGYIDGDVLRKPNTVRRHPSASRGIGRYVSRFDASDSGWCSGGN